MYNIWPLVQNEMMKMFRRIGTWVMIGLLVAVNLLVAVVIFSVRQGSGGSMMEYVAVGTELVPLVLIFSIVIAGGIVASEFSWGTIKLLLIRPVNRTKILLSKYIATLLFILIMFAFLIASSSLFGTLFFGIGQSEVTFVDIIKSYGFASVQLIMIVTFSFMISAVFRSSALAITLSFVIYFFANGVIGILSGLGYNWGKYIVFANTNLAIYFGDGWVPFEGMTLGFSISVIAVYFVVFSFVSWLAFIKRDVSI